MIKRLLSGFILMCFMLTNTFSVLAQDESEFYIQQKKALIKEVIISKSALSKFSSGEKYIKQIDTFVAKNSNNLNYLIKVRNKLTDIEYQLEQKGSLSEKEKNTLKVIQYFGAKVDYQMLLTTYTEKAEKMQGIEAILQDIPEEKMQEDFETTISNTEVDTVEAEIIDLQLNLFQSGTEYFDALTQEFEQLTNYEETGDFNLEVNIDEENIGELHGSIEVSDMSAKASNFDAQISGKVEALVDASLKGQEAFTYELSSFIDFISKDGNLYLLLDKLDVSHNSSDYGIIDFTSAIKKIAKENKYIQFSDAETEEAMSVLKKLNPSLLKEQGNTLFAQPMFTAYKKEGEKYYLKPTKYACDSIKELANIFDPFNGTTCTTGQYNDLLEEYGQLGIEVYLVIGKTQDTLGFSYTDGTVDASGSIVYTDSYIASVDIEVIPDQDRYPGEGAALSYKRQAHLNAHFDASSGDIAFFFKSDLDRNNNFTYIDYSGNIRNSYEQFTSNLQLEGHVFNGGLEYTDNGGTKLTLDTSGRTNTANNIQSIYIEGTLIQDGTEIGTLRSNYISGKFENELMIQNEVFDLDVTLDGTWDTTNKVITSLTEETSIVIHDSWGSEESYELFASNFTLQNKQIQGKLHINNDSGEETISIETTGSYEKDHLVLNNTVNINPVFFGSSNPSHTRDNQRSNAISELYYAVYYRYSDYGAYPKDIEELKEAVSLYSYIDFPTDPLGAVTINNCNFGYTYQVDGEYYEISTCLENENWDGKYNYSIGNTNTYNWDTDEYETKKLSTEKVYINGYTSWSAYTEEAQVEDDVIVHVNLESDTRNNAIYLYLFVDVIKEGKKIFDILVKNDTTRTYKKVEINAPKTSIPVEDLNF